MIPDLIRDVDKVFVGERENVASRISSSTKFEQRAEGDAHDRNPYGSVSPRLLISSSK
jgi:hypothetical protein